MRYALPATARDQLNGARRTPSWTAAGRVAAPGLEGHNVLNTIDSHSRSPTNPLTTAQVLPHRSALIVDPAPATRDAVASALGPSARVEVAPTLMRGLERLSAASWQLVVLSLDAPAVDFPLVKRMVENGTPAATILLTAAQPTIDMIFDASRLGTLGVLATPLQPEEIQTLIGEVGRGSEEVCPLIHDPAALQRDQVVVGTSPAVLNVFRTVGRVARSSATVLILGESGTGKEMIARTVHQHSDRANEPFVAINCAAIPENLLESELFGHEKGAFTGAIGRKIGRFERAHGGTLLLDEIGDMSIALQSKILRALQEREIERVGGDSRVPVDVRIVAATNRDLRAAIAAGEFREDLYFRLAVITLQLPRLVDRGNDIELLATQFVSVLSAQYNRDLQGISRSVFDVLRAHSWPGNIRELKNVMERAVLLSHGPVLLPEHLPLEPQALVPEGGTGTFDGYAPTLTLAEVERLHIARVLQSVDGHFGNACEVLGIHRNTLTRKAREYGLGP